jgi:pyruvate,water dikinase
MKPDELIGFPGSPGIAQGTVKVVHEVSDAGKLNPDDILLTEYTLPSWSPLFARTAALVTDSGGVLSHSAVVAREYGIPAVVGTGTATAVIRDGQVIEVDGTAGRVRMVSQNDNMQL